MHSGEGHYTRRSDAELAKIFAQSRVATFSFPVVDDHWLLALKHQHRRRFVRLKMRHVDFPQFVRRMEYAAAQRQRVAIHNLHQDVVERNYAVKLVREPLAKRADITVAGDGGR